MLGLIVGLIYRRPMPATFCVPDTATHIRYTFRSSHAFEVIYFYIFNKFHEHKYSDEETEVVHGPSLRMMDLSISIVHAITLSILKHTHHHKPSHYCDCT